MRKLFCKKKTGETKSSCQVLSISVILYSKWYKIGKMIGFEKPGFRWKKFVKIVCILEHYLFYDQK